MKHMLVIARIKERTVTLQRPTKCSPELSLLVFWLESHKRMLRIQRTISQIRKSCPMKVIGTRFSDHIDYGSPSPTQFCSVGIGRNPKLLHYFIRKLIRSPIPSSRLRKEAVVIVRAIHQIAGLKSANSAKRQVSVRRGSKSARVLTNSGSQQSQIGEPAPIQRQVLDRPLIYHR